MSRLHGSPLGPELDAARVDGGADVLAMASGRRPVVRATRLPTTEASWRVQRFRCAMEELFGDRNVVDD